MDERLRRLRELMGERGYDCVVVRENASLRWLTGAERVFDDEVAHTAVIAKDGAWLHTDSRYIGALESRLAHSAGWETDAATLGHERWVAQRLAALRARVVAIEDTLTLGFYERLRREVDDASQACLFPRLHGDLARLRMVKEESELALMRRAQEVTDDAFAHLCGTIRAGQTELEVRAELEHYMLAHGADGLSFDTIVASGPNGANPHARPSSRRIETGDLVVIDFGALLADYHADMTRTVCVGEPSARQREVYDVVRRAHERCAEAARPGMRGRDLHELAVSVIAEAGYGDYFGHGLGHGVGIEIHERPYVGRRGEDTLEVGCVFTIEPGIYLPHEFGIRLEDCGVMGEDGYEPFTASSHELVIVG